MPPHATAGKRSNTKIHSKARVATANQTMNTPSSKQHQSPPKILIDTTNEPMQNYDGTEMRDASRNVVYKSQFLSTHPLRGDCKEKPGFGEFCSLHVVHMNCDAILTNALI
jgi:hypothetical protein